MVKLLDVDLIQTELSLLMALFVTHVLVMQRSQQSEMFGIRSAMCLGIVTIRAFYLTKNNRNIFRKISLYVVRTDDKGNFKNSAPCGNCTKVINELRIKKVVFSTEGGSFVSIKSENYKTDHISHGNRHIQKLKVDPDYKKKLKNKENYPCIIN